MPLFCSLIASLFVLIPHASADEDRILRSIQTREKKCLATAVNDEYSLACVYRTYVSASDELLRYYGVAAQKLQDNGLSLDRLQKSQETWREYVQSNCSFEASSENGGSDEMRAQYDCLGEMTIERIRVINRTVEGR